MSFSAVCFLATLFSFSGTQALVAQQPMNVLVIQTDEHNFRTLGCYREHLSPEQARVWGDKAIVETPHIDSLARRGALCTSFYATSPVCTPSRAAFISGRYPHNTGAPSNNLPLRDDVVTFAKRLNDLGYKTGYAGKWHLDGPGKPQWQPDRHFGFVDNRFMFNRGHWKKFAIESGQPRVAARGKDGKPSYAVAGADETSFATDWLADRTIEFIKENAQSPFCYYVSIPDPHGPNTVRPPYDTMFDPALFSRPKTFDQSKDQTPRYLGAASRAFSPANMARYFGMVKCIDDNVGRILKTLEECGVLDRTVVVFTSDHGDLCGEHHRDNKGNPYEASARVPFVIAAPGKVPAGIVLDQAMTGVDFAPTLMHLLGHVDDAAKLDGVEGRDLTTLLTTGKPPEGFEDIAFLRRAGTESGWVAAVTDRYKLVLSPEDVPWLFDLEVDPDELQNFFADNHYQDVRRRLAKALSGYGPRHGDPYLRQPKIVADLKLSLK